MIEILSYEDNPQLPVHHANELAYSFLLPEDVLKDKNVLEVGPGDDGRYSKALITMANHVLAVDVFDQNTIDLSKMFIDNKKYSTITCDIRDIKRGNLDVCFHVGVLYHLKNPEEHLETVAKLAPVLILDTHYENGEESRTHGEGGGSRSGPDGNSIWLTLNALVACLEKNYREVKMIKNYYLAGNHRVAFLCRR